jgi:hypothetical protein
MRRVGPWVVGLLGAGLAVAGVAVFWATNLAPADGPGWFAYAPLVPGDAAPSGTVDGWAVLWTRGHLVGAGLLMLGLLVIVGTAGWSLGRRSSRR